MMKKTIEISDQPRLSLARTVRITVDGIRYRLFRASVTVAVIAVAVAFLMNILSESLIKRAVAEDTHERVNRSQFVHNWMARLTAPGTIEAIIEKLAVTEPGTPVANEMSSMSGLSDADFADFYQQALVAQQCFNFFADLDYAKRRNLVHTAGGVEIFERLRRTSGMEQFQTALPAMKSLRFPLSDEELDAFLAAWPNTLAKAEKIRVGRRKAIEAVKKVRGRTPILTSLADANGQFGAAIREAGFHFDGEAMAPVVEEQAHALLDARRLEKSMEQRTTRQAIAQHYNILPADVNVILMWKYLRGKKSARKYLEKMNACELDTSGLTPERLSTLANARQEQKALVRAERLTIGTGGGWMGLGERLSYLLLVSMLVCGIGISNAMLMTVTERFTEIATLKCLGALDGFIMLMFVLESCFLGVVGGAIGAVLGCLIGLGRMLSAFGPVFAGSVPVLDLLAGIFIAVTLGVILAAAAAVYPSLKAARLAPMEAMRIE